jgi:hypothetical protein
MAILSHKEKITTLKNEKNEKNEKKQALFL